MTGSLEELNLGKNIFKDKGGIKIGEALRAVRSLRKLNLSDNNLTDETAYAINRNILAHKSLDELNLQKNLINIRTLELVEASMVKIQEAKLREVVPDLRQKKATFKDDRQAAIETNEEKMQTERDKVEMIYQNNRLKAESEHKRMIAETRLN